MAALREQFLHMMLLISLVSPCCYAFTWGKCRTICRSKFCREAPLLRYGKYCGLFYSGCPGEDPCDGLDRCCMTHDHCIGKSKYLSKPCNQALLDCVRAYQNSGDGQFSGNTCKIGDVENTIKVAIEAGIWIGNGNGIGDGPTVPSSTDHLLSSTPGPKL
ncbi:phospholipase A2-alpha-like [Cryptomeria japonica]|uniref:phospholipase A2-alpha-like n=1 Tax=Cryptomeria japonica TaxID=3369 RepID=UPI0027DA3B7D|nr:phospholipase A2-alpha-like [Cryptomeria japonica]